MSANLVDADSDLEVQIDRAYWLMVSATNDNDQRKHWAEMVRLIRQRSPEQVYRMESERRLSG